MNRMINKNKLAWVIFLLDRELGVVSNKLRNYKTVHVEKIGFYPSVQSDLTPPKMFINTIIQLNPHFFQINRQHDFVSLIIS